jgi:aconitase A
VRPDHGAEYDDRIEIDLGELGPLVAKPHNPDNVVPVEEDTSARSCSPATCSPICATAMATEMGAAARRSARRHQERLGRPADPTPLVIEHAFGHPDATARDPGL